MINPNERVLFLAILMAVSGSSCSEPIASATEPVYDIQWVDGDSGRLDGVRFRLADVDAPETGPVGSERGARCVEEQRLGNAARTFMQTVSRDRELSKRVLETDRYGREVVLLFVDGQSVVDIAMDADVLRSWPHASGRALHPKPIWCAG